MIDNYNKKTALEKIKNIKLFIFDMDGTIYLGNSPFPEAIEFINKLSAKSDKRYVFFTNNASKSKKYYYEKLQRLGFHADIKNILTSAEVLISYLKKEYIGKQVYLLGTPLLEEEFKEVGIDLLHHESAYSPDIVVTSFDTTLTYNKLERACTFIRNGALWFTTHPDINCPVEGGGYIPDCGAINTLISASTDKTPLRSFGKPSRDAAEMIGNIFGTAFEDMLVCGDRLYTDIALGRDNGILSALVLTGEASAEDMFRLDESKRPDLIFDNIGMIWNYLT